MGYKNIIVERKAHIAVLTLNRPDKLNAMNPEMNEELKPAIEDLILDDDVRVVVITGAGKGFSAGAEKLSMRRRRNGSALSAMSFRTTN